LDQENKRKEEQLQEPLYTLWTGPSIQKKDKKKRRKKSLGPHTPKSIHPFFVSN